MPVRKSLHLRGARDRLIDLLDLGETSPLQDTEVRNERLTVPIGMQAKIPIVPGQIDVRYLLRLRDGTSTPGPGKIGNGEETLALTPALNEDVTFEVLARKIDSGREAYLHETATVRVKLDTTLPTRIEAPLLDPAAADDTAPRVVDYGSPFVVAIDQSQEGAHYRLVHLPAGPGTAEADLSPEEEPGDRDTIRLHADPVFEDTRVRVRVIKRFDSSEGREDQSELLVGADGKPLELPLMVRPNPALQVTVEPAGAIEFGGEATIKIAASQASCRYQAYLRRLTDSDFLFDDVVTGVQTHETELGDADRVRVLVRPSTDESATGFSPIGPALAGNGADLALELPAIDEDGAILVEASKDHSRLWLEQAATLLVEPDPDRRLAVRIPVAGEDMRGDVEVSAGQPGVLYYLRGDARRETLPAYVHQLDELDQSLNKGLGGVGEPQARRGLRVEVDLAIARAPVASGAESRAPDRAVERPLPPVVDLEPAKLGVDLAVRAVKARSGAEVKLAGPIPTSTLPEIRLEEADVELGDSARILVVASHDGDRYQPFLDGEPVKQARNGNGEDLVFVTGAIERPTTFELVVSRPEDDFDVTYVVELPVGVSPTGGDS